jgi:DNA polymerase delta subunit 1
MQEESLEKCASYIKSRVSELLQNKIDIGELVITKALTKKSEDEDKDDNKKPGNGKNTYKVKQAHTELAEKMRKR